MNVVLNWYYLCALLKQANIGITSVKWKKCLTISECFSITWCLMVVLWMSRTVFRKSCTNQTGLRARPWLPYPGNDINTWPSICYEKCRIVLFFFNFFRHDNNDADSSTAYTKYDRSKIPKRCAKLPDLTNDYPHFSIHFYFGIGNSMNISYLF